MIEKVYPFRHNGKGMVLRVTDERLRSYWRYHTRNEREPTIQEGRIIGAVTYVFK